MNTNEIIHINGRYMKQDCDLQDENTVVIRIKTGKDINQVQVIYNDPYIRLTTDEGLYWPYKTKDMRIVGETYSSYYFECILNCAYKRLKYYFVLYDFNGECIQYSESGFTKNYAHDDLAMFFIPYITSSNIFMPPNWVQNTIWYQILPIRFNKNLKGITDKLDYLQDLGINGLYINPIYKAHSYHKYDVIDYEIIDEELGNEEDFKKLCQEAHKRNMKVMLDISFTHCSDKNPMFQDVLKNRRNSPYFNMFKILIDNENHLLYETFGMIKSMPKFETESFQTISYFANKVIKKWMNCGVDAWRYDVANEISDDLLLQINRTIKNEKKDTYIVGEIWHRATEWISNNALDGVTNYAFSRAVLSFICGSDHDIFKYRSAIDELRFSYTSKQLKSNMILLDSHDTPRLCTVCNHDLDRVKAALVLLLTFYGTPSIYYGTERFMEGGADPDNRRETNWNDSSASLNDIYQITKLLIRLRKEHPALANDGSFTWIEHSNLLIYRRKSQQEELYIIINKNEHDIYTTLPWDNPMQNVIDQAWIQKNIFMKRLGFMILKK